MGGVTLLCVEVEAGALFALAAGDDGDAFSPKTFSNSESKLSPFFFGNGGE